MSRYAQVRTVLLVCAFCTNRAGAQQIIRQADASPAENATVRVAPAIRLAYTGGQHEFHLRGKSTDLVREVLSAFGITAMVAGLDASPDNVGPIRFDTEASSITSVRRFSPVSV